MKRQPLISQGSLSRLLKAATESFDRSDYQQCIEILERANRLAPAHPGVLLDLGRVQGMCYDYAAAERYFEKAVLVTPQKTNALAMAGVYCRGFGRYDMAKDYFERAAQEPNASPDTFVKLAELYERLRFLDEAAKAVDRALQLDPACVLALLVRARLNRLTGKLEEAEKLVRSFLGRTDPNTWSTRIRGWYELGAILDRQGRYEEAMTAFLEAKTLIRPNAPQLIVAQRSVHALLKEAETSITAEVLQRWFDAGKTFQPPLQLTVLCGHPRSGTTLLEQVLDSHPEIISAEETSIFFETYLSLKRAFPKDARMSSVLESASPNALQAARKNYFHAMESLLDSRIGDRLLIDKNPSLTSLVPAVGRVFPEAKFLMTLRDPRDVCLSAFMQPLPLNQVSAIFLSLEDTTTEYASLMSFWRTLAPRLKNPYIEVRYEDMVDDLESASRRVLGFLGKPWDARILHFDEHARQKLVRSPTYTEVTKPVFKGAVGRWRNYQKYLEPHLEKLAPFVAAFGYE